MKRIVLGILFFFSLACGGHVLEGWSASMDVEPQMEKTETSEATSHTDQIISVLIAANSVADVSVQTVRTFSPSIARRYRPAGFPVDRMFEYLVEGQACHLDNTFKIISGLSQVYAARLKHEGYYIYTLRKIIV